MPREDSCCCCMTMREGAIGIIIYDIVSALIWFYPGEHLLNSYKLIYLIPGVISYCNKFKNRFRKIHFIWRSIMDGVGFFLMLITIVEVLENGTSVSEILIVFLTMIFLVLNIYFDVMLFKFWKSPLPVDVQSNQRYFVEVDPS